MRIKRFVVASDSDSRHDDHEDKGDDAGCCDVGVRGDYLLLGMVMRHCECREERMRTARYRVADTGSSWCHEDEGTRIPVSTSLSMSATTESVGLA